MGKRHSDALAIQLGACNPSGVALAIVEACAEIRAEPGYAGTASINEDPAVRLMVHQLAFLCRASEFDSNLTAYYEAGEACRAAIKVKEG